MRPGNTTGGVLPTILLALCIAGPEPVRAQTAPAMPSWLAPFPGAAEETRQSNLMVESTYTAAARPHAVLDHYRRLFASVQLPFRPSAMGYGFMIRVDTEDCNLAIVIRNRNDSTAVRVTCAAIVGPRTGAVLAQAEESERKRVQAMEKYDRPVYPPPKSSRPRAEWPPWLVHIQGSRLRIADLSGQVGPTYLKSTYTTGLAIPQVQSFYENLLSANGCSVSSSPGSLRVSHRVWLQGSAYPEGRPGRRVVVRVELMPAGNATSVELRVTEFRQPRRAIRFRRRSGSCYPRASHQSNAPPATPAERSSRPIRRCGETGVRSHAAAGRPAGMLSARRHSTGSGAECWRP